MPKNPTPQQIELAIQSLTNQVVPEYKKAVEAWKLIGDKIAAIQSLEAAYKSLTGKNSPFQDIPNLPEVPRFFLNNESIGDALVQLLEVSGKPLTKNEILEKLRAGHAKISLKSPRVVLNTAIKRDKQNRFKVSEDGMVSLRKEDEK
ncbi:MAG: hypothetical protein ABR936_11450 [Bacteroidota bacterium]|jgi:hypothetical protein